MEFLSIRLSISYAGKPPVLDDLRLDMHPGEVLGLVGHSGCGKSSLALAILGLLNLKGGKSNGSIRWEGHELLTLAEKDWRKLRGRMIAYVPQSPMSSLNPALRLGTQMQEAWKLHGKGGSDVMEEVIFRSLRDVGLPPSEEFLRRYPSEISVGQAQRVLIGMAIMHRPALLIADEPTSALDAVTQAEILALFGELNRRLGMSMLFISHDLLAAYGLCHRIALVHGGKVVECGTPHSIFFSPQHPFTQKLISALPTIPSASEIEAALRF